MKKEIYIILGRNTKKDKYDIFNDWYTNRIFAFETKKEAEKLVKQLKKAWSEFDCVIKKFKIEFED